MSGSIDASSGSAEPRHRLLGAFGAINRRKSSTRDKKANYNSSQEKKSTHKFSSLKLILFLAISATFFTIFQSPMTCQDGQSDGCSYRFLDTTWIWTRKTVDSHGTSDSILKAVGRISGGKKLTRIGLLNFNETEATNWNNLFPDLNSSIIELDNVDSTLTWETLYPEWVDEEKSSCPSLPSPRTAKCYELIAVMLPCNKSGEWTRDVTRLHLQLSAAKLAVDSAKRHDEVHVMFVSECFPLPNLFRCKDIVIREGGVWLYKPDMELLKRKIELPVGSCQVAVPQESQGRVQSNKRPREAYATILHSADLYVCGAIAAAQSIRMSGSTKDLIILVDETIHSDHRHGLESAGWKVRTITRIRNPMAEHDSYNEWNYSKFRLWQLTDYDKIVFIDADLIILRNIDFLFSMPEITATGNNATLFNSGVMVVEPDNCTFNLLINNIKTFKSYNGGDQGYLNEIFTWWHRVPRRVNFLKHFWVGDEEEIIKAKNRLFAANPPQLNVIHYLGQKPWLCFRDYDCNWNIELSREFASDVAHERWWKVHDAMPERLQRFCMLSEQQKEMLKWERRLARKANFSDGHWRREITDQRLRIKV